MCMYACAPRASRVLRMIRGMWCHFAQGLSSVSVLQVHSSWTHTCRQKQTWASETSDICHSLPSPLKLIGLWYFSFLLFFVCNLFLLSASLLSSYFLVARLSTHTSWSSFLVLEVLSCSLFSCFCNTLGSHFWDVARLCPCYKILDSKTNELKWRQRRGGSGFERRSECAALKRMFSSKAEGLYSLIIIFHYLTWISE